MSYLADIYRNFDAHFAEENASMVSFPNCTEVGSIVFIGAQGSGKNAVLGQMIEKFRHSQGSPYIDEELKSEIRNVIFKIPIIACPPNFSSSSNPLSIFENCKSVIVVVDCTSELPIELILSIANIRESLVPQPEVHVFLHKVDLLDGLNADSTLSSLTEKILDYISDAHIHHTSINDGTSLLEVSLCIEHILPKIRELKAAMQQFSRSLELSNAFLVDLQSRAFLLSSGDSKVDEDQFLMCQDGVEMFVGIATMMEAKSAQPTASVELKDGTFLHFFWSTYDVILVGISDHRTPTATSKNNVIAFLHTIRKILK